MTFETQALSLKQKIGQVLMIGFDGTTLNDHVIELIKNYHIGNVILFARNCESPEQIFQLTKDLQKLALESNGIPLFIGIDQEGGMVTRIFNQATFFPGAMTLAATGDPKNAYAMGNLMGKELKALGINMNLAPVLDVNNNPKNPVIGVRSYSDDPQTVSRFGIEFILGLQNHVIATAKHFPGHGDTTVDSHLGLPRVEYQRDRLDSIELFPFKKAIEAGVHAIMSAHIQFPKLSKDSKPATLSKTIMTDLLRSEMGFEGLIITDGMNMKAIVDHYGTEEAALMALDAGANQICVCHEKVSQIRAYNRLLKAFLTHEIDLNVLDERVSRVLAYKATLNLDLDCTYASIKETVENKDHHHLVYQMVQKGVTQVLGKPPILTPKTLFIGMLPKPVSEADDALAFSHVSQRVKTAFPFLQIEDIALEPQEVEIERILKKAQEAEHLIICTYNANIYRKQLTMIQKLLTIHPDLRVLSFRNPYDLIEIPEIRHYTCFYEYTPHAMTALLAYLNHQFVPEGRCPIHAI